MILIDRYGEYIQYFINEYLRIKKFIEIRDKLNLGEVLQECKLIGSKKGNRAYNFWRNKLTSEYNNLIHVEEETVFEKFKKSAIPPNTLFEKFKRMTNAL